MTKYTSRRRASHNKGNCHTDASRSRFRDPSRHSCGYRCGKAEYGDFLVGANANGMSSILIEEDVYWTAVMNSSTVF